MRTKLFGFNKQQVDSYLSRSLENLTQETEKLEYQRTKILSDIEQLEQLIMTNTNALKAAQDRDQVMDAVFQTARALAQDIEQEFRDRIAKQGEIVPIPFESELAEVHTKLKDLQKIMTQSALPDALSEIIELIPIKSETAADFDRKNTSRPAIINSALSVNDFKKTNPANLYSLPISHEETLPNLNNNHNTTDNPENIPSHSTYGVSKSVQVNHEPARGMDNRQFKYILGNIVGADLHDANGILLAAKGDKITQDIINRANEANLLVELVVDMELPDL